MISLYRTAITPIQSPTHHPMASTPVTGKPVIPTAPSTPASNSAVPASSGLIEYTRYLQRQNWRLRSEKAAETIKALPPLQVTLSFAISAYVCLQVLANLSFLLHSDRIRTAIY